MYIKEHLSMCLGRREEKKRDRKDGGKERRTDNLR